MSRQGDLLEPAPAVNGIHNLNGKSAEHSVTNGKHANGVSVLNGKSAEHISKHIKSVHGKPLNSFQPDQENGHIQEPGVDFLQQVLQVLLQANLLPDRPQPGEKTISFKQPHKLKKLLELGVKKEGCSENELLDAVHRCVEHSVRTGNPLFLNQLYGGLDPYGLAGALLSEALNTSQYTYEVAPVFTLVEEEVVNHYLNLIGYKNGEGIFSPGGSMSNMYAICLARYLRFPDVKQKGLRNIPPLIVFASQDSHYSIMKAVNWLGMGTESLVKIETDEYGCMNVDGLRAEIEKALSAGQVPLAVIATAGTTVLGAFDPIEDIAQVCSQYKIWMHVDACLGGSLIFSKEHSNLLKGLDRTNSVAWNAHKMLGAPLQCSMFVVNHKGLMHNCNSAKATYLFQQDKMYDTSYDTGDMSIQCGRKVDAFKLWLMWKSRGDSGFGSLVDRAIFLARYFEKKIKNRQGFRLVVNESQSSNVCFWYIPERLRGKREDNEWWNAVGKVTSTLKGALVKEGNLMISYQPLTSKGFKNFFRLAVTCHPPRTTSDMDFVIQLIEETGNKL